MPDEPLGRFLLLVVILALVVALAYGRHDR